MVTEAAAVRAHIGLSGQYASVDDCLTGRANLVMIARLSRLPRREARNRAAALLAAFDLEAAADRPVRTYSGGMRRRLDLAASLLGRPSVLFLDEPTTGLDPGSRLALWSVIDDLVAGGTTLLLTTQYLDEADRLADRICIISGGRVTAEGSPADLKARAGASSAAADRPSGRLADPGGRRRSPGTRRARSGGWPGTAGSTSPSCSARGWSPRSSGTSTPRASPSTTSPSATPRSMTSSMR